MDINTVVSALSGFDLSTSLELQKRVNEHITVLQRLKKVKVMTEELDDGEAYYWSFEDLEEGDISSISVDLPVSVTINSREDEAIADDWCYEISPMMKCFHPFPLIPKGTKCDNWRDDESGVLRAFFHYYPLPVAMKKWGTNVTCAYNFETEQPLLVIKVDKGDGHYNYHLYQRIEKTVNVAIKVKKGQQFSHSDTAEMKHVKYQSKFYQLRDIKSKKELDIDIIAVPYCR